MPRELGFAQGRALRAAGAPAPGTLARWRERLARPDAPRAAWLRDVRRHFPHQAEWLEGAARGSGLSLATWVREASARLAGPARGLVGWEADGAPRLACAAAAGSALRRMQPEGRFRSLELAEPWLPAPWIGVNEAGLAVAACAGAQADARRRAPGALFARDCLERFESVASALTWCLGRPAAPGGALLFADAAGELAGVELDLPRRVRRPEGGVLALGASAPGAGAIAKRLRDGESAASALADALGSAPEACAQADARTRRLVWGGAELELGPA